MSTNARCLMILRKQFQKDIEATRAIAAIRKYEAIRAIANRIIWS